MTSDTPAAALRLPLAAASGIALAVLLASCGGSGRFGAGGSADTASSSRAVGAASSSPVVSAASTSSATSSAASSPTSSAAPTRTTTAQGRPTTATSHVPVQRAKPCTGANITVTLNRGAAQLNTANYRLHFTNVGSAACTLTGFPGADVVTSSGGFLGHITKNPGGTGGIHTIFLASGEHADALLDWSTEVDGHACTRSAPALKITPPNTFATAMHRNTVGLCNLAIHPVYHA